MREAGVPFLVVATIMGWSRPPSKDVTALRSHRTGGVRFHPEYVAQLVNIPTVRPGNTCFEVQPVCDAQRAVLAIATLESWRVGTLVSEVPASVCG